MTKEHIMDMIFQRVKAAKITLIIIKATRIQSLSALMTIVPIIAAYANGSKAHRKRPNFRKEALLFFKTVVNSAYLINPYMIS
ncbi:MAG: hypothetical protein GY777_29065 [Candidatus Brocadiaceae bacterium]|nr:hypothetical protein [Candidatus Brocadiaceae bacterium]